MALASSCATDHTGVFIVQPFDANVVPLDALLDLLHILLDPFHLFLHGSNEPFTDRDLLHERLHLAHTHFLVFAGLLKYGIGELDLILQPDLLPLQFVLLTTLRTKTTRHKQSAAESQKAVHHSIGLYDEGILKGKCCGPCSTFFMRRRRRTGCWPRASNWISVG
ncbi:MAG: Uncharacterised protein [Flavobacteriia bacterium]|nr:MAG: Uncharacterised protein [Flavobacteriia bacterium]